jgi:chromate transporter
MPGWQKDGTEVVADEPDPRASYSISQHRQVPLRQLAVFFLRLGITAFGGPAAHIAIMEDELVRRRHWLSREKFLDLLGASNLIPGPSSSELAIHIGYLCAGLIGLLIAGTCFILPAAVMVAGLGWLYVHFGKLPTAAGILYGIKPVVIAVVLQALWGLGRTAVNTTFLGFVAVFSLVFAVFGFHPLVLLLLAGGMACLPHLRTSGLSMSVFPSATIGSGSVAAATSFSLGSLFLVFLKMGASVFGSGYVLLAFLRADLVTHRGWLTEAQLVDAVAVGQVTPGPVFTTATFIGFILGGIPGAVLATVGIFLPAFILVAVSGPLVPRIRKSKTASAFLDGVNVASLALIAAVGWQLARASLVDATTFLLAVASLIALLRFRLNSAWLILLGATIGLLTTALRPR